MPEKMRTERGSLSRPARTRPSRVLAACGDRDRNALDRVVRVALQVPGRLQRLAVPGRVGGSGAEHVLAGRGVPLEAPAAPGGLAQRLVEEGRREGRAVGRDL